MISKVAWTPELDAKVRDLWELGWPAVDIAERFGLTKGQISGRTFRKRWVWGAKRVTHTPTLKPKPPPPKLPPTLLDLKPHDCRWPVNSPERGGLYLFCGLPALVIDKVAGPYCPEHAAIGFSGKGTARAAERAAWQPRQAGF